MAYRNLDRMDPTQRLRYSSMPSGSATTSIGFEGKIEVDVVCSKVICASIITSFPSPQNPYVPSFFFGSLSQRCFNKKIGTSDTWVPMGRCARRAPRTPELRYPPSIGFCECASMDHDKLLGAEGVQPEETGTAGAINVIYGWPTGSENAVWTGWSCPTKARRACRNRSGWDQAWRSYMNMSIREIPKPLEYTGSATYPLRQMTCAPNWKFLRKRCRKADAPTD